MHALLFTKSDPTLLSMPEPRTLAGQFQAGGHFDRAKLQTEHTRKAVCSAETVEQICSDLKANSLLFAFSVSSCKPINPTVSRSSFAVKHAADSSSPQQQILSTEYQLLAGQALRGTTAVLQGSGIHCSAAGRLLTGTQGCAHGGQASTCHSGSSSAVCLSIRQQTTMLACCVCRCG